MRFTSRAVCLSVFIALHCLLPQTHGMQTQQDGQETRPNETQQQPAQQQPAQQQPEQQRSQQQPPTGQPSDLQQPQQQSRQSAQQQPAQQQPVGLPQPQQPSTFANAVKSIQSRVEADLKLDQPSKDQISGLLASVQANEAAIQTAQKKSSDATAAAAAAEKTARASQTELEKIKQEKVKQPSAETPMESLDADARKIREEVDQLKEQLESNEAESTKRIARRQNSRSVLETIEKRITDAKAQLQQSEAVTTLIGEATTLKLRSDVQSAEAEKKALNSLLARDEAEERESVLKKQHDLVEQKLTRRESLLKRLETILATKRQMVADKLAANAKQKLEKSKKEEFPLSLLTPSYQVNDELATKNQQFEKEALKAKRKADVLQTSVESLEKKFVETNSRVTNIGLTGSIGALLRTRKAELAEEANNEDLDPPVTEPEDSDPEDEPPSTTENTSSSESSTNVEELQFNIFDIDQQEKDLSPAQIKKEIIESYRDNLDESTWKELEQPVGDLIEARLEILKSTRDTLTRYSGNLLDIQRNETNKAQTIKRFRDYINERILWIRSNNMLFSQIKIDKSDFKAFSPFEWSTAGSQILSALALRPALTCLGALICISLLFLKPRLRKEIDQLGEVASRGSCESFWPTARTFVLSLLITVTVPLIPLLIGLAILYAPFTGSTLFLAVGRALVAASLFALPFETLRRFCRPDGLGNQHFDWPANSVSKLKNSLDWVVLPGATIVFSVSLLLHLDLTHRIDLLERILFVGGMLFATYFLYGIYNKNDGVFSGYLRNNDKSWANQTSAIWLGLILVIPLALAFLAFWGYYYTALNLAKCAYFTFVFAVIVETIRAMGRRLVLTRQRRSFIQAARRKRQAQIEAQRAAREERIKARKAAAELGTPLPEETNPAPIENFDALTEMQPEEIAENVVQAQKLISLTLMLVWGIGLWLIWIDVLPALKELDNYTIWPSQVVENGFRSEPEATSESGAESSTTMTPAGPIPTSASDSASADSTVSGQPQRRVTIRDLLLFFVISTVTWVLARSLPSAIEILFLEELPVDRSFRYAIKALTSYAIVLIGVLLAFNSLSISWSSVQWLATALTFGLAFGLQEIFANFVAGIILMFERPMRIGDLITVDEFTGVVTKIRTRATTIINWDRKEYVIPNKDFITGRLVNWTLSDAINRIEFTVGVAYGSDVEKAKSIIYDICKKHPKVVDEPGCQVVFNEFGESSLNLKIRAFIGDVDSRPLVTDSLHTLINNAFNEAEIEISFPQLDLHFRSNDIPKSEAILKATKS